MSWINTDCKFCQKPLTVEFDDIYASLGDPYKLLGLATCNRCGDLKVEQRRLTDALKRCCTVLISRPTDEQKKKIAEKVDRLTKDYLRFVSEWTKIPMLQWDCGITESLMQTPDRLSSVLGHMWRMAKLPQQ